MLKEKIFYRRELPVNVITANIEEYPIHFHDDMEIVYVLEGTVTMRNGYYTYELKPGDVFILNDREMHSFQKSGGDNMVMMLQIDLNYFSRYYDSLRNSFFVTDLESDSDESIEVLREILARIMMEILQKGHGYEDKVIESAHNLITELISDFQYFVMDDGRFRNETRFKGNKILAGRLSRITDYMYDNYTGKLTLGEIAEREHLSVYYLSHVIKESTGLSFQDLLSYIRVEESERLLLGTSKKIGAISAEVGFSAVRYYIKHFQQWFGMHPLEYRSKYSGRVFSRESKARYTHCSPEQIEEAIRRHMSGVFADYIDRTHTKPVIVDIDAEDSFARVLKKKPEMEGVMSRPVNAPLGEMYRRFLQLDEKIIASGPNYIVTTPCEFPGRLDRLSILVFNMNENLIRILKKIQSREELLHVTEKYREETEFLVRCSGFDGDFRILRWRIEPEQIRFNLRTGAGKRGGADARTRLKREILSQPVVSFSEINTSDTLSVRSVFKGLGAELILINSKEVSE